MPEWLLVHQLQQWPTFLRIVPQIFQQGCIFEILNFQLDFIILDAAVRNLSNSVVISVWIEHAGAQAPTLRVILVLEGQVVQRRRRHSFAGCNSAALSPVQGTPLQRQRGPQNWRAPLFDIKLQDISLFIIQERLLRFQFKAAPLCMNDNSHRSGWQVFDLENASRGHCIVVILCGGQPFLIALAKRTAMPRSDGVGQSHIRDRFAMGEGCGTNLSLRHPKTYVQKNKTSSCFYFETDGN